MTDLLKFQRAAAAEPSVLRRTLLSIILDPKSNPAEYQDKSDEDLALLVAKITVDRLKEHHGVLWGHKAEHERLEADVLAAVRKEREEHEAAREKLIAEIRALKKEIDPDEIRLKIMYAVDEATAAKDKVIAEQRATIVTMQSEIEELKRAKKRLREALDRLAKDT